MRACAIVSAPLHILVVDDDGDVRQVIADMLLALGYRVSLAKGGEAMRAFLETPDAVELIVLDATMPGEPSVNLALHAKRRGIRLIMISGNPDAMREFQDHADQLLWKPFRQAELRRAVEHALSSQMRGQRREDPD
jgi:two-component system, OmpR family, response regulator